MVVNTGGFANIENYINEAINGQRHFFFEIVDINECENNSTVSCNSQSETCENTDGSYLCICLPGFRKESSTCKGKSVPHWWFIQCMLYMNYFSYYTFVPLFFVKWQQTNLLLNILKQFTANTLSSLRFISEHLVLTFKRIVKFIKVRQVELTCS